MEKQTIDRAKIDKFCHELMRWADLNVRQEAIEVLHAGIAMEAIARMLKSNASSLASNPDSSRLPEAGSLLQQSLEKKVELTRKLRDLLGQYREWVGGEVLVCLSEAIAEVEGEIGELTEPKEAAIAFPPKPKVQRCPVGHTCPGTDLCSYSYLCQEVEGDHRPL